MSIASVEYAARRRELMARIGRQAVAIIAAPGEVTRNNDVHYPYRPASDFRYLTGFCEPDAVAVLAPGREDGEFLLFCRPRDAEREIWDGLRAGPDGAREQYGANESDVTDAFVRALPELLAGREQVYFDLGADAARDKQLLEALGGLRQQARRGASAPAAICSLAEPLHHMRLFKSEGELALMREAGRVSAAAHARAMRACRPGMNEFALAAELHHEFERHGMSWAYPSIVGGGGNACILHYIENAAALRDGDLVLIDAGAEHAGYAADITRTFPVNGEFSGPQRAVYEVVLAAQQAAVAACQPGNDYQAPHRAAVKQLTEGLVSLGMLRGEVSELVEAEAYRPFYMHGTGHWLGMDVHDVGDYKIGGEWRLLEPGMTLTIEPGLYFRAGNADVDERYWDIGVRIEDDIHITADGPENLTDAVPKTVDEIQALMADRRV
jgi:Xaa-Pro aminopeptidase